jgi:hypothetical protein
MRDQLPNEKHAEFAREVVALARKHGMDGLSFSFRASFGTMFPVSQEPSNIYSGLVNVSWSQGRHGDKSDIKLRFEGSMSIAEGQP